MKKFGIVVVLIGALGLLLAFATFQMYRGEYSPREIPSPLVGKPLPTFSLPALHDTKTLVTPESLHGQVYLLNVWASWCVACRYEHPLLVKIHERKEARIVGLNYKDKNDEAHQWLRDFGNPYDLSIVDAEGRAGIDLGVYGVPETFVIDKQGVIRYKFIGPISEDAWEKKLRPLLKELTAS